MSSIVMRITDSAAKKSQENGIPIAPLATAQVAVAALVGTGTQSLEAAVRWKVPFYINDRLQPREKKDRKFPLFAVIDRSKQMLRRAISRGEGNGSVQTLGDIEMEVKATELATIVVEEVRAAGLCLYTQKLLFAPELRSHSIEVLSGLVQPGSEVTCASVAIAHGAIPRPPSNSTKGHLLYLGPKPIRDFKGTSFAQWVAEAETLIVEYPLPDIEVGDEARYDYFSAVGGGTLSKHSERAGLGLGFFVVRRESWIPRGTPPQSHYYFNVLTPVLHHSGGTENVWAAHRFASEVVHENYRNGAYEKLEEKLRNKGRTFIAKLKVCPGCNEIYCNDRADLKKGCDCAAS